MYYLLENNRIVQDEELIKENKKRFSNLKIEINENELQLVYFNNKNKKYNVLNYGKVKNQSENVFDLIDWKKDIIRITWSDGKSFILYCDISKSDFSDGYYSLDWITAIYKPDANGNYIKVLEVEDE